MAGFLENYRKDLIDSLSAVEKKRFTCVKQRRQHPHLHPECAFCRKIKANKDILLENRHIVVMFGRQHHKGHLLVMPKAHEEDLLKLHQKTLDSFMNDTMQVMKALGKAIKPDLFNLEYLDNWDHHIHWNIYPRFRKDKDWGNPPVIPLKGEKFKEMPLTKGELDVFKKELRRLKNKLW
ncbi:HIT family protein [Candidatus Woesearchaeota archaeon]|nr:HIT family protein [Candidatus Woesearchaeota archaeon]